MKLKELEALVLTHLQESGEIRTDLKWLKKAFWTLTTAAVGFNSGVIMYLVIRGH